MKKTEENYARELQFLKSEKDVIVQKSREFAKNLQSIQLELQEKRDLVRDLKTENRTLRDELASVEEKVKKSMTDRYEKDSAQQLQSAKEEAYFKGRRDCSDEMTVEITKLRGVIDGLRADLSIKSKRVIELQFEVEELSKAKKKMGLEVEDLGIKLNKEREGQRELQFKLEGLLEEVAYLKNLSRQFN